jgi:signal transduction histidine kinase/CheY-like chemotaxis protein/HAMP domain-containing protein
LRSPKAQSISRRFSYAFIGVVTVMLLAFAAIAVFVNIARIDTELKNRLDNALKLAQIALPTPLWNLDNDVAEDFVQAMFLDESLVYMKILWGKQVITEKKRAKYKQRDFASFQQSPDFISKSEDIVFQGNKVGTVQLVMSRESVRKNILFQISGIVALTILIIVAISLTSMLITRRYVSRPLAKLQSSASAIAQGDLETFIDKGSRDEIGMLAQDLDVMRGAIKEAQQNLEQKVEERTQELKRSVEELKALGEVSQAVNSTLELDAVLARIVTHAVHLSQADAGTIYEFDENEQVFVPRANHGLTAEVIEALRAARVRVGDNTGMGQAAETRAPVQIADLMSTPQYALPQLQEAGFRALFALPLLRENHIVGGLVVRRKTPGEFPATVVDLVRTFAAQSAVAIHNVRLFQEIQEKSRQLEIASQHKSQFLANMSHELRTPLNAIIGFSEVLLEKMFGEINEKQEEYLNDIFTSGKHLLNLINDILDLSKIEAGKMELEPSTVNLRELLEGSLVVVKERALAHGIKLSLNMSDDIDTLIADERKVKQVVFNLLSNAVKFTPDNGEVSIHARRAESLVEIAVRDTGIGIAPENQQRVFEEFQQVGETLTGKPEGTGLGLTLTRKLVELHGGTIWLESTPGQGSTFTFTLPISGVAHGDALTKEQEKIVRQPAAPSTAGGQLVLVIEDDPKAADLMRIYLNEAGYAVETAKDGADGLQKAKQLAPRAIILDVLLPKVDGWSFLTQIKTDPETKNIPVIIASIIDQKGKGFALGAADYLVKPIDKMALLNALATFGTRVKARTGPIKVLAIDDDPKTLELLAVSLEPEGFQVLRSSSGEEGVEVAKTEQPDIIILDLLMPGINGFEVLDRLKASPLTENLPVVLFTVKQLTAKEKQRLKGRIARLAQKQGYDPEHLVDIVKQVLQSA